MFGDSRLRSLFDLGDAGVQFFFVLSGFIIYYVHRDDIGRPARARRYLLKRIIRIYPVYILVTLVLTPFWAFVPEFGAPYHKQLASFVFSIFLIPQDHVPNLGVAWTLTHEVMFYFVFALLVLNRRVGMGVMAVWFTTIAAVAIFVRDELAFPFSFLLSINNLLFAMGLLAATRVLRLPPTVDRGWLFVVSGSVLFMAVGVGGNILASYNVVSPDIEHLIIVLLGLASVLIVLQSRSDAVERVLRQQKVLNAIGAASFSIYLIHQPVMSLLRKLIQLAGWEEQLGATLFFVMVMVVAVLVGWVMYRLLELPMLNYFTQRYVVRHAVRPVASRIPSRA